MVAFRLFRFPVEVRASFLLLLLFVIDSGLSSASLALFLAAVFASVLIHELGHAFTARAFGATVHGIRIYALGGLTLWSGELRGWQRFAVAANGAGGGFAIAGLLYLLVRSGTFGEVPVRLIPLPWRPLLGDADLLAEHLAFFLGAFIWVSVVWGAVNWLPIGGLDGSRMLGEGLRRLVGPGADLHTAVIGLIVAAGAGYVLHGWGFTLAPVLFLWFAGAELIRVLDARRRARN